MACRALLGLCLVVLLFCEPSQQHRLGNETKGFWIADDIFWKDGEPFRILGGDVHYFRIVPEYWQDRLLRGKALGLNTIQMYVPWNLHEPRPGEYIFHGIADLESFVRLAQQLELLVMMRIGPYICAEWDFGGFPAWLLAQQPPLRLRSSDPYYLHLVDKWWDVLLPKLTPLLYENGGPIIMVQVENEFGSYGRDTVYLEHLVDKARFHLGENIIIYTTDGGVRGNLENGTLRRDDVYAAVDFAVDSNASAAFALQRTFNAKGKSPSLIAEFYTGWLTHWTERITTTSPEQTAAALDKILSLNASAVLYMAHGGTNFGFYSGANSGESSSAYKADITSYDYDAPIGEAGDVAHAKFTALRRVLAKHSRSSLSMPPPLPLRIAYGGLHLAKLASFFDVLKYISVSPTGLRMEEPCTMEFLNQISGFVLYEAVLPSHSRPSSSLSISKLHDRAQVIIWTQDSTKNVDPCHVGILERWSNQSLFLPPNAALPGLRLQILVENMGRLNYGPFLYDPKGILSAVLLDGVPIKNWTMFSIPLDDLSFLKFNVLGKMSSLLQTAEVGKALNLSSDPTCNSEICAMDIGFYSSVLHVDEPADTFLSLKHWSKGVAFVNGFNVGRYWPAVGPQCTLYIPGPILQEGDNEVVIFELERPHPELLVDFVGKPDFTCGRHTIA